MMSKSPALKGNVSSSVFGLSLEGSLGRGFGGAPRGGASLNMGNSGFPGMSMGMGS
jgi:hypothetical protein